MSMPYSALHIKISPESLPSTPCWFAEASLLAHVFTQFGLLHALEERVRFARPRFDTYDTIDFFVVLLGYAVSAEPSLKAFYERLVPFGSLFMALFGRSELPSRSALSRFLAALDQSSVEALRTLFEDDLVARAPQTLHPGALWDRQNQRWLVIDVDGTKQPARQRALPQTPELPAPHRRFDRVCAPGYLGRKRGQVARTRTTVLQAHSHHWLGSFSNPGNGDYRKELAQACQTIIRYAGRFCLPLSHIIIRLDGLYGNGVVIQEVIQTGIGLVGRCKDYGLLDLPAIRARLMQSPDQQTIHPASGACRDLFDVADVPLNACGPRVRMIVATHPATSADKPSIGVLREETVFELFVTTLPNPAFCASDVLDLYLHRGSFETVLADEDQEQDTDRWCSRSPWGQQCWQIFNQWVWNLRCELGQHLGPSDMRQTEFAPAHAEVTAPMSEPSSAEVVAPAGEPIASHSAHWARPSFTKGFAGNDFLAQPNGTLLCPAGHPLFPREHRREAHGVVRIVYGGRIVRCRPCPLRAQCQESTTTKKPRQVSLVLRPITVPAVVESKPASPVAEPAPFSLRWDDWPRCSQRRQWIRVLRAQTVDLAMGSPLEAEKREQNQQPSVFTRAQRAKWRLSWQQRLDRNARLMTDPPVQITIHGLPASLAAALKIDLVTAA